MSRSDGQCDGGQKTTRIGPQSVLEAESCRKRFRLSETRYSHFHVVSSEIHVLPSLQRLLGLVPASGCGPAMAESGIAQNLSAGTSSLAAVKVLSGS